MGRRLRRPIRLRSRHYWPIVCNTADGPGTSQNRVAADKAGQYAKRSNVFRLLDNLPKHWHRVKHDEANGVIGEYHGRWPVRFSVKFEFFSGAAGQSHPDSNSGIALPDAYLSLGAARIGSNALKSDFQAFCGNQGRLADFQLKVLVQFSIEFLIGARSTGVNE